jgi:hypothetical protein
MFVGAISKANKKLNKSETAPISTRSIAQLMMTAKRVHSRGNLFVRKCADLSHCPLHYTRIDYLYKVSSIDGGVL